MTVCIAAVTLDVLGHDDKLEVLIQNVKGDTRDLVHLVGAEVVPHRAQSDLDLNRVIHLVLKPCNVFIFILSLNVGVLSSDCAYACSSKLMILMISVMFVFDENQQLNQL